MDYSFKVKGKDGKKERITTNIIRSGKPFVWTHEMKEGFAQYETIFGEIK